MTDRSNCYTNDYNKIQIFLTNLKIYADKDKYSG